MTENPNDRQVGGEHYKREFQHWDLMARLKAGYFTGQITKYTERHPKKNGKEDLEKALHFAEKFASLPVNHEIRQLDHEQLKLLNDYLDASGMDVPQRHVFRILFTGPDSRNLLVSTIRQYLRDAYPEPKEENVDVYSEFARLTGMSRAKAKLWLLSLHFKVNGEYDELVKSGTPEDGGQHAAVEETVEVGDRVRMEPNKELVERVVRHVLKIGALRPKLVRR